MANLDSVYAHLWTAHTDEYAVLDRSLQPRPGTFLFDVAVETGLGAQSMVADVGCGRGNHCLELTRRFGCRAVGIDRVLPPLQAAVRTEERPPSVEFVQGDITSLPIAAGSIDFVWCRDMLVHVNVAAAARECFRILRAGGKMLAWVTVETSLMERQEAARLYAPLAIEPASLSQPHIQESFRNAGFRIARHEEFGSELIEFYEERDGRASRELMRIARMRRSRRELVAAWGEARYESAHALYHWVVYHLLGKLSSGFYLFERPR